MAFGQIDPARLEGDALRRWYLRSPEDIEDERLRRADQRYDAFYGGLQDIRQSASPPPDRLLRATGFGSTTRDGTSRVATHDAGAVAPQSTWSGPRKPRATIDDCVGCHGRLPSPPHIPGMLPPFGELPLPGGFPVFRNLPGATPSGPRNEGRKECELQDRNDRRICGRQPTAEDRARCHASASERRANCDRPGGTIGDPALDTANRLRGNPPLRR